MAVDRHEGLRLRAAKLAAAALLLKRQSGAQPPFSLAFMTDRHRAPHPELIARALPKGAAVIVRDYDAPKRAALAARLASICKPRGVLLLIGADPELALSVGADGVHAPHWFTLKTLPQRMLLTAASHNAGALARARRIGASLALLSPAYATASHAGAAGLSADAFRALAARAGLPVLALGGVDAGNAAQLSGPNVAGLAAIGAFLP